MADIDDALITDKPQRERARDPERSCIVQAPAGSGKTELLTQRYLRLLGRVDEPEEILAVTFTRKAAAEMRSRIINAMFPPPGEDERLPETIEYANRVVARDRERGWDLARYPARLRIRTIDSVNAWLSATAPLTAGGQVAAISETPEDLYRRAAQRVVAGIAVDSGVAVRDLLAHLDNSSDRLINLVASMLARRDQWVGITLGIGRADGKAARAALESLLHELVSAELRAAGETLTEAQQDAIAGYLAYAAGHLAVDDPASDWHAFVDFGGFPAADAAHLAHWRRVAWFLLTGQGSLRKSLDKRSGFPPGDAKQKAIKKSAIELLQSLSSPERVEQAFQRVRDLPEPAYTDSQWQVLQSLLEVLHLAVAELQDVMAERGESDYTAVAQGALRALRDDQDAPTDLALRLDFRIEHILIDEFQDTSSAQMALLRALTEGWSRGDGRTLFIVGDPMQSIYRFRKAEVGLFIELQRHGLPNIDLEPLVLDTNFRSDPVLVDWVNRAFARIMPPSADLTSGAVTFARSNAARQAESDAGVCLHGLVKPSRIAEAGQVIDLIRTLRARHPGESIAVLVRTRRQAALIAAGLQAEGIAFSGTGLENTVETPVVQDLLCITRALSHRADRTAWLGLLRAPWCGLTLADLELLAGQDHQACVWDLLIDPDVVQRLSADGRARAARVTNVIGPVFSRRGSLPLRDVVTGVWTELGGPAFLQDEADLERAEAFFDLLDACDVGGDCPDGFILHEQVSARLQLEDRAAQVNLMTIHKSKGLEFDSVILPALEAGARNDDKPVLAWQEVVTAEGRPGLVIAPIERTGEKKEPIFEFARRIERQQAAYEQDRLLYVAATRAKRRMHLFVGLALDDEGEPNPPPRDSLAGRLWPSIESEISVAGAGQGDASVPAVWQQPKIRRCSSDWSIPSPPPNYEVPIPVQPDERMREVTYDWASPLAQHVGTIVHRWLERITREGIASYDEARIRGLHELFRHMLRADGLADAQLDRGAELVTEALCNTLTHEQGRWLIDNTHTDSAVELPVTFVHNKRVRSLIIDRTFVDSDGVRWIVDYKTSSHEGGGLEEFFAEEVRRYRDQLTGYRQAMQALDPSRPVRTALYFPLLKTLREVATE